MNEPIIDESQEVALRRFIRQRRSAIFDDYVVYLQELKFDLGIDNDPVSFSHAIESDSSIKWLDTMEEELKSMDHNEVWDLVELPEGCKRVGCKWVFKTKRDSNGNIERHKARLFAKGFTQKDGVDFKETFSPISKKDSFRIIMEMVAHYDLELHQMGVKTGFLNGNLCLGINLKVLWLKENNTLCVNLRSQYTDLNKLPGNGLLSSMIPSRHLDLRKHRRSMYISEN